MTHNLISYPYFILSQNIFHYSDNEPEHFCKLEDIRPRARVEIDIKELKPGQKVMINHNTEDITEKGYWYDDKNTFLIQPIDATT